MIRSESVLYWVVKADAPLVLADFRVEQSVWLVLLACGLVAVILAILA